MADQDNVLMYYLLAKLSLGDERGNLLNEGSSTKEGATATTRSRLQ